MFSWFLGVLVRELILWYISLDLYSCILVAVNNYTYFCCDNNANGTPRVLPTGCEGWSFIFQIVRCIILCGKIILLDTLYINNNIAENCCLVCIAYTNCSCSLREKVHILSRRRTSYTSVQFLCVRNGAKGL